MLSTRPPERTVSVVVTGIKPTGVPHLGNYAGMLRPTLELIEEHRVHHFIADLHALTDLPEPDRLERWTLDSAALLLAAGLDPERAVLFRQSDVPELSELQWILSCLTSMGMLERAHAYKAAVEAGESVDHGLFAYPVLMAADILALAAGLVPVGPDQKQHLEIARDLARRFNHHYGDTLVVPEPLIPEGAESLPGLDGRKMSKSYGNTISLVATPAEIRDRVASIVTDSTARDEPKDPGTSVVFAIFSSFASDEEREEMAEDLRSGSIGWKEAKERLGDLLVRELGPLRERFEELRSDPDTLETVLSGGARRARERTRSTLDAVRSRVGLRPFRSGLTV